MRPFAWVSLDRADSDPVRFWSYAIAALRTIEPGAGAAALAALPMAGPDLVDAVIAPLINDLAASSQSLVLVLDDYHLVHSEPIHASKRAASVVGSNRHRPPCQSTNSSSGRS